jgi:ABC-type uncharacterized transport system substrate-binding protein
MPEGSKRASRGRRIVLITTCLAALAVAGAYWHWGQGSQGAQAARAREDVAGAVRAARNSQAEALNVFSSPVLSSLHREIIAFAAEYLLPAIYQWKEHAEAGGLVSYGPNLAAIWRQSAIIVAKLLKGVKPADHRSSNQRSSSWW